MPVPAWQNGPNGPLYPWSTTNPYSEYQNSSYIQNGWLGGDPNAGVDGDPGGFGNNGGSVTMAQVEQNPVTVPSTIKPLAFQADVNNDLHAGNYKAAVQETYNTVEWTLANTANTTTRAPLPGEFQAFIQTWSVAAASSSPTAGDSGLECLGAIGLLAASAAALGDPVTAPAALAVISSGAIAVGACVDFYYAGAPRRASLPAPLPTRAPTASSREQEVRCYLLGRRTSPKRVPTPVRQEPRQRLSL